MDLMSRLLEVAPGASLDRREAGSMTVQVAVAELPAVFALLGTADSGFAYELVDLTGVDLSGMPSRRESARGRFQVWYHFVSSVGIGRLWLLVSTTGQRAEVPTATTYWPAAGWLEREVFDMFGLQFVGHPHLRRLLLPEYFVHWPLRRDYPTAGFGEREQALLASPVDPGAEPGLLAAGAGWQTPLDREPIISGLPGGPHDGHFPPGMRFTLTLAGDTVARLIPDPGWLHTGLEKLAEDLSYLQLMPVAERFSGMRGLLSGLAYVLSAEQLLQLDIPPRAERIRHAVAALSHVRSHLAALAVQARVAGSSAAFHTMMRVDHRVADVAGVLTGSAAGTGYLRIGGVRAEPPEAAVAVLDEVQGVVERALADYRMLLLDNRAWIERVDGLGALSEEDVRAWGLGGVALRATGVRSRRVSSEGAVAVGELEKVCGFRLTGDARARTWMRWAEVASRLRAARAALDTLPPGPCRISAASGKGDLAMAAGVPALIEHFELWMDGHGLRPVAGRHGCVPVAGPEGEIGFLLISDGTGRPYRVHLRAPSLFCCQVCPWLARGVHREDLPLLLASLHMDAVEQDR